MRFSGKIRRTRRVLGPGPGRGWLLPSDSEGSASAWEFLAFGPLKSCVYRFGRNEICSEATSVPSSWFCSQSKVPEGFSVRILFT